MLQLKLCFVLLQVDLHTGRVFVVVNVVVAVVAIVVELSKLTAHMLLPSPLLMFGRGSRRFVRLADATAATIELLDRQVECVDELVEDVGDVLLDRARRSRRC